MTITFKKIITKQNFFEIYSNLDKEFTNNIVEIYEC